MWVLALKRRFASWLGCCLILCSLLVSVILETEASPLTRGAIAVNSGDLFQIVDSNKIHYCALVNGSYVPGKLVRDNLFLSFKLERRNLLNRAKTNSAAAKTLTARAVRVQKLLKKLGPICKAAGSQREPDPGITGNFTSSGQVTAAGKLAFGIPDYLSADITTGRSAYNNYCAGCHEERVNRSFSDLRENTKRSPMFYDENTLTDATLAQITAFLNRFRP